MLCVLRQKYGFRIERIHHVRALICAISQAQKEVPVSKSLSSARSESLLFLRS
jgi:hypothetical protein